MSDFEEKRISAMQAFIEAEAEIVRLSAENERLRKLKTPASRGLLNVTKACLDSAEAENVRLTQQVARDEEHYQAAMAMNEKHRKLWVEASQQRDALRAEIERLRQQLETSRALCEEIRKSETDLFLQRDAAFAELRSSRAEIARLTDENRKMNATLARDAIQIFKLEAENEAGGGEMSKPKEAGWGTIAKGLLADGMVPADLTKTGRDEIRAALDMVLQMSAERDVRLAAALRELDHAANEIERLRVENERLRTIIGEAK